MKGGNKKTYKNITNKLLIFNEMESYDAIIRKLECRVYNLRGSKDMDFELRQMLKLIYILKHCANKKKNPPVDGGGALQMSLSL